MKDRDMPAEQPGDSSLPCYRVFACGPFLVKRWEGTSYQAVPVGAWGGSHYPRVLLKVLLCSPGRQASRGRLQEVLWPDTDPEEASRYLNDAAYRLRKVLQPTKEQESLLLTAKDASTYSLAGQELLWMDADAALALVEQVELVERRGGDARGLLEEAVGYLSRGEFLEDEGHLSFYGRRATIARARRGCLLSLARVYGQRGWMRRAEVLLSSLLEENPLDEDAVRALMLNLHQQERTSEALRLYEETRGLLEREGLLPTEATRVTELQLRRQLSVPHHSVDWGEAPRLEFYGRERELAALTAWLDSCRLVALVGMGGIGKTSLAVSLVEQAQDNFASVFWRSLQHAPPLTTILQECIKFLAHQQETRLPVDVEEQISLVIKYLQERRCLLVLDNLETVFQEGTGASCYREGYEEYGLFIKRIGEGRHRSCLLLTSRERPKELSRLEGGDAPVRTMYLSGVSVVEGRAILKEKGLLGSDEDWAELIRLYAGNPLALKLIAEPIRELFRADIAGFLKEEQTTIGDIHHLLGQQFKRLSECEQAVMYWLAVKREAVSQETLWEASMSFVSKKELFDVFASLRQRSMIETDDAGRFTLQPVIMEYVTDEFIKRVTDEIHAEVIHLLASHALIEAQVKEYVRETQIRLILVPILDRLLSRLSREELEQRCKVILASLHKETPPKPNYAAGNLLNLMIQMRYDLRNYDFSCLSIRQAFLQGKVLPKVNFAYADLSASIFTDTFGSVFAVAFHPDGNVLAAGTASGEVRLWDVTSGMPLHTCRGHMDWVRSVAFRPDGHRLASGSEDQTVKLWDVQSGQCLMTLEGHENRVRSVAFTSDGKVIASGSEDQTVRLWDASNGQPLHILRGHTNQVRTVAFSPDGRVVASGSEDQTVRLWDASTGQSLRVLQGHACPIFSIAFSPNGQYLVSAGEDPAIRLWEISTGRCLSTFIGHRSRVRSVAFHPDGQVLASGSEDQTMRLWDISTGQHLKTLDGHTSAIFSIAYRADGSMLTSGSEDQTVRLWESGTGQHLKTLRGYADQIRSLAFNANGSMLTSGSEDQTVRLWDVQSEQCIRTFHGHTNRVRSVAFSPGGQTIVSGSEDQTVRLWDVNTGQCLNTLHGHTNRVRSVAFSPDGSIIASGSEDQTIRLWNVSTGICLRTLHGHTNRVRSVAFSPDGSIIASAGEDQTVRLWSMNDGQCLRTLQGHASWIWSIAFHPDGETLVSGSEDQTVRLWEVKNGQVLRTLHGHTDRIRSVAFSPDGNTVASGSEDQTVRLWDVRNGGCLKILQGHTSWVWAVAFSPNGKMVASGSHDGTVKIWEVRTGTCLKTLRGHRPYEGMNITGTTGLTPAQKIKLKELGAVEDEVDSFSSLLQSSMQN